VSEGGVQKRPWARGGVAGNHVVVGASTVEGTTVRRGRVRQMGPTSQREGERPNGLLR
jgi:hypothetical protein